MGTRLIGENAVQRSDTRRAREGARGRRGAGIAGAADEHLLTRQWRGLQGLQLASSVVWGGAVGPEEVVGPFRASLGNSSPLLSTRRSGGGESAFFGWPYASGAPPVTSTTTTPNVTASPRCAMSPSFGLHGSRCVHCGSVNVEL